MTVYVVEGNIDMDLGNGTFVEQYWIYGIFSSEEKANKIANDLRKNISENDEREEVTITEMKIDEPTNNYYFMMHN